VRKQCPAVEIIVEVFFTIKTYSNALDVWVALPVHGNMHQDEQIGILGDHLKAAIRYHFKTGHREAA
jgi:hypothetical protein